MNQRGKGLRSVSLPFRNKRTETNSVPSVEESQNEKLWWHSSHVQSKLDVSGIASECDQETSITGRSLITHRLGTFSWSIVIASLSPISAGGSDAERNVSPVLKKHCFACHGDGTPKGGLDLRTRESVRKGGKSGAAVVAGKPEKSLLLERVTDGSMPPEGKPRLTDEEKKILRDWIHAEAAKPDIGTRPATADHWAFRPLVAPPVPTVKAATRVRTPVDAFVLAKLESKGLALAPDAARLALLRRVTFDLIGLPPTPDEADAFLADESPQAYDKVVDRLLASPHYGERWGRHWLDAAGYADTIGTDNDVNGGKVREGMWRYRDYVVRSLNTDKPFDRFLLEQLAGDLLFEWDRSKCGQNTDRERNPDPFQPVPLTAEQKELLAATGFLRTAVDGTNNYERNRPLERHQVLYDTVEILTSNLFGLTVQCARCHDHKYDPITQRDYYRLMAFLTPAYNPANWIQPQFRHVVASTPTEAAELKAFNANLDKLAGELGGRQGRLRQPYQQRLTEAKFAALPEPIRTDLKAALAVPGEKRTEVQKYLVEKVAPLTRVTDEEVTEALTAEEKKEDKDLEQQKATLRARRRDVEKLQAIWDVGTPPATMLLKQGNFETPGAEVAPGLPAILASALPNGPRRLALAKALTATDSLSAALIARTQMNRLWHHHFGRGIVATPGNLGRSGAAPTHPELLDFLAYEFIKGGWKLKAMHRLIVTSSVYRQSAKATAEVAVLGEKADSENTLLWHSRLRRLESEAVRDALLAVSGQLDRRIGGPFVPLEGKPDGTVAVARAEGAQRRSLYLYARRNFNLSLLAAFDQPLIATNCTGRQSSVVVPQALAMLNDPVVIEAAGAFARRVQTSEKTPATRIALAFRLALGRPPMPDEMAAAATLLEKHSRRHVELSADDAATRAMAHLCQVLLCTNEFLYVE